jgi:predicted dehydrogenase
MNKNSIKKVKTCFIGLGKRAKTFYIPILKNINEEFDLCGFTKKTKSKVKEIEEEYKIPFFDSVDSLIKKNSPELVIICVPPPEVPKVIDQIKDCKIVIFVDTPVFWNVNKTNNSTILASEQWPFLPIEQFKKILISSGELGEVFYAENESRTFEYHGIAQLRNYFHPKKQIDKITGSRLFRPGEEWSFGIVRHSDNTGFLYKFSYFVKKSDFRTHQALKTYCTEGSIISGCLNEKGNDYEIFKISKDGADGTEHYNAIVERSNKTIINKQTSYHSGNNYQELSSISCQLANGKKIIWENPFSGTGFNDQEIAIATLLTNAKDVCQSKCNPLYSAHRSFEDYAIMNNIQQSSHNN